MEQEDKWKLLKMVIRCNKCRKHKPKKVQEHQLKFEGEEATIFPEEKVMGFRPEPIHNHHLREVLRSIE